MKGIIFNLLEDFITEGWGEETYDQILSRCPLHATGPFVGPGTYADADLMTIVAKTTERLGISVPEAVHAFGKYCFPRLAAKFPMFVEGHTHPKSFLKTIDAVIHVEVRKLFKDAEPPTMRFVDPSPDELLITYISKRKLCTLMEGLLDGTAEYFKTPIRYGQSACVLRGAETCEFHLTFGRAAPT
jgi:predicted hydrocarbon binding protein